MARLEIRRRYTWSIFQSIEYAGEQDQLQLSSFFTFMLDNFTHLNLISHVLDPNNDFMNEEAKLAKYEKIEVPDSYAGPRLSFPLTVVHTNALLSGFKQQQTLHPRYVLQLLHETKKFLKHMPNIIHLSTTYTRQITVCGDLHGKLDDLLLIFYKNGLPSDENPYLFNGDFVDRGKKSMEIIIILFAFLLVYPNNMHLNRGNHEDYIMNLRYGFTKEVMQKYKTHGREILQLLQDVFSFLPIATIIDNKVLIVHGGISDFTDLDVLASIERHKVKLSPTHNYNSPGKQRAEETSCHLSFLQIVDLLWSDPKNQNGCIPNSFRGGGCYFGPDVTLRLLKKYNLQLLIRSHECKQDGYELCHDGKVITIFSASNYYEEGSNRGAYIKLGPDLVPRFFQYQVTKVSCFCFLHSVTAAEGSALKSLREKLYAHKTDLIAAFKDCDKNNTGRISTSDWASAVESVLHLDLPWRTLRSRLVKLGPDGNVDYLSCFEDLQIERSIKEVTPCLMETLYRYRTDLEIIFNIIDKDHSGLISIEEFRQTWKLFSSHLHIPIDDEAIDDLARSIDYNKDGSIDFNEFLEAFRVVHKLDSKEN
uniref:Serine/threonine-protein phosphatase n=1 Tax=Erpetoichthys calabaricus TaxID=27687 RepID=A0A8C4RK18_ERPCA